jgi:pyrroloquinoline quinone biosynthesis protein D
MTRDERPKLVKMVRLKLDPIEQKHVLLAPERGIVLSASAAEILTRCDGERTIDGIAAELADDSGAPFDDVRNDVVAFVEDMAKRGFVEIR